MQGQVGRPFGGQHLRRALIAMAMCGALSACDEPQESDGATEPADVGGGFRFKPDTPLPPDAGSPAAEDTAGQETAGTDAAADIQGTDVALSGDVIEVQVVADGTLVLAGQTPMAVTVKRASGLSGPPSADDKVRFVVNGAEVGTHGWIADSPAAHPPIAIWNGKEAGIWRVIGARPGKASLVVEVGGKASDPIAFEVSWPSEPQIVARVPDAVGSTAGEQQLDADDTVKLGGKTLGGGGLEATIRFPADVTAGAALDVTQKPSAGGLSIQVKLADLAQTKYVLAKGVLWIDQVDGGLFRGTFAGLAASLKPMVGVFVVERSGQFGIDLLGAPVQLAKSDALTPASGHHYSRAAVHEVADGQAMVTWRHIENLTKAHIERVLIDPKTGAVKAALPPIVADANAYAGTPDVFAPAVGRISMAASAGKWLVVWEGRDGKGAKKPHQVWARIYDDKHQPLTDAVVLSDDHCEGACRPHVSALPSSRWLVVWSGPNGGVRARRVAGNISAGLPTLPSAAAETLDSLGKGASAVTWENNVLLSWWRSDLGPVWRMYGYQASDDKLSSGLAMSAFGAKSPLSPTPAVAVFQTPSPPPNLLFVGAWQEQSGAGQLHTRRVAIDGTALGLDLPVGSGQIDLLQAAAGKSGQLALLDRPVASAGAKDVAGLRARKVSYASLGDAGSLVGPPVTIAAPPEQWLAEPSVAYIKTADVYVVVWSGDHSSGGVWMRRFR